MTRSISSKISMSIVEPGGEDPPIFLVPSFNSSSVPRSRISPWRPASQPCRRRRGRVSQSVRVSQIFDDFRQNFEKKSKKTNRLKSAQKSFKIIFMPWHFERFLRPKNFQSKLPQNYAHRCGGLPPYACRPVRSSQPSGITLLKDMDIYGPKWYNTTYVLVRTT